MQSSSNAGLCSGSALSPKVSSLISHINQNAAVNLASQAATSYSEGLKLSLNSIFYKYSADSACNPFLESVNVVYDLSNTSGNVKMLVFAENPSLTVVQSVSNQAVGYKTPVDGSWAGYEYQDLSNPGSQVTSNSGYWWEPSASIPSGGCSWKHCDYNFWVGETPTPGGSGGYCAGAKSGCIAQTGSDSAIYCGLWCTWYYYTWYEWYPNPYVTCNGNVGVGDYLYGSVSNTGGSSPTYYMTIYDETANQGCSVTNPDITTWVPPVSYYAQFTGESGDVFSQFSQLNFQGGMLDGQTINGGWTTEYTSPHVSIGAVSYGDFSESYQS